MVRTMINDHLQRAPETVGTAVSHDRPPGRIVSRTSGARWFGGRPAPRNPASAHPDPYVENAPESIRSAVGTRHACSRAGTPLVAPVDILMKLLVPNMSSFDLDYLVQAANILLLAAFSVRDMLWLRLLAVASSLATIPYFLLQPTPSWAAFGWSVMFTWINIFQAWRLLLEQRPVRLSPEEEEVGQLVFRDLTPRKVLQVLSIGSWGTAAPGQQLIAHGKPVEAVSLIVHGKVRVTRGGEVLGDLGAGEIVGSALLLSGALAEVDGVTVEPTRIVRWEAGTLKRYLDANPETRNLFQRHLARDLTPKLQALSADIFRSSPIHSPWQNANGAPIHRRES